MEIYLTKKDIQTKPYNELLEIFRGLDELITYEYKKRLRKFRRIIVQRIRPGDRIITRSYPKDTAIAIRVPKRTGLIEVRLARTNTYWDIIPEFEIDYVLRRGRKILTVSQLKEELGL